MSKSKGNVINPMQAVSEYGSDALRLGLIANRTAGQNQAFSIERVIAGRNFCNKLWNIARFIEDRIGEAYEQKNPVPKTMADHWIMRELSNAITLIGQQAETYRLAEASETMYHAIWDSVADWYIEASKTDANPDMLAWVLDTCLKISHPFAPFVTETIWQSLPWHNDLLITTKWPSIAEFDDISAGEFDRLINLITEARFVTNELPGNERHTLLYQNDSLIADNAQIIKRMSKLNDVIHVDEPRGMRLANSGREAWLDISAETLYEHQTNLELRLADAHKQIAGLNARLENENYVKKAPTALVEESKKLLAEKEAIVARLVHELEILK